MPARGHCSAAARVEWDENVRKVAPVGDGSKPRGESRSDQDWNEQREKISIKQNLIEMGGARARLRRPYDPVVGRALYVGLSGGIGAGKSTVAEVFESLGAHVFSADQLARDVVALGTQGLAEVVERFGREVLLPDGSLDRAALAKVAFTSDDARRDLEQITHPLIGAEAKALVEATEPGRVAVYDVPLLVEGDLASQFDVVVMVHAPLFDRLERLEARGLSVEDAKQRMAAQAPLEARKQVTSIWVDNAGAEQQLAEVAGEVYKRWLAPSAVA